MKKLFTPSRFTAGLASAICLAGMASKINAAKKTQIEWPLEPPIHDSSSRVQALHPAGSTSAAAAAYFVKICRTMERQNRPRSDRLTYVALMRSWRMVEASERSKPSSKPASKGESERHSKRPPFRQQIMTPGHDSSSQCWGRSSVGQSAALSRQRSRVRAPSSPPYIPKDLRNIWDLSDKQIRVR